MPHIVQVATWVVTPELFSTETRTMGHSSCTAVSRIGSFLASFVVISSLNYTAVGCILGVLNVLAAVAAHFLPDTSGTVCCIGVRDSVCIVHTHTVVAEMSILYTNMCL